jgi:hypothetical protein
MPRCTKQQTYRPYLLRLMHFFHGVEYDRNHQFSRADLDEITPEVIRAWMCDAAYGDPYPNFKTD